VLGHIGVHNEALLGARFGECRRGQAQRERNGGSATPRACSNETATSRLPAPKRHTLFVRGVMHRGPGIPTWCDAGNFSGRAGARPVGCDAASTNQRIAVLDTGGGCALHAPSRSGKTE
jgi:hypothetical protein